MSLYFCYLLIESIWNIELLLDVELVVICIYIFYKCHNTKAEPKIESQSLCSIYLGYEIFILWMIVSLDLIYKQVLARWDRPICIPVAIIKMMCYSKTNVFQVHKNWKVTCQNWTGRKIYMHKTTSNTNFKTEKFPLLKKHQRISSKNFKHLFMWWWINTLSLRQNGHHVANDTFNCIVVWKLNFD